MEFSVNGSAFRFEDCIAAISMEIAKRDLDEYLAAQAEKNECPSIQARLDVMFDSYVRAYGYLADKRDEYVKTLLANH